MKVSCFGKPPNGVAINAEDVKFILSPIFNFRLNANSEPINAVFFINFFKSPFVIFSFKKFRLSSFFSSIPLMIIPLEFFFLIPLLSPEYVFEFLKFLIFFF